MSGWMPIGIEDFGKLRKNNYYFVDKTDFIRRLIDNHSEVTLFTRPRRFGKTLMLSMIDWFFSIEKKEQSKGLFDDLAIAQAGEKYMTRQGTYPVLFVSLKNIEGLSWPQMLEGFRTWISNWCISYSYLTDSERVNKNLQERFRILQRRQADEAETANILYLLMVMLKQYYGKNVILLLDEYDAPIEKAWENGFYDECISFMKQMLGSVLKTNDNLAFALLTGVLRAAKESIFSGLNNLSVCTVMSKSYADVFGFTNAEVKQMAENLQKMDLLPQIQEWYDGYRFGTENIYNPWSVINFFVYRIEILSGNFSKE